MVKRKRSNPTTKATDKNAPSKCKLHNMEEKGLFLTPTEIMQLGFCKEDNAFQCMKTDCEYHVEAVK